jgi:hypothetical protein
MKKVILSLFACLMVSLSVQAQVPQSINFQSVIRNNAGDVIKNQSVRFRLSITEGLNGAVVFSETHQATTNALGLVNISIGTGSVISGIMASLNWSGVQKYLKIEVDVTGGTNFTLMGTQQLVSVPYSLFADKAGSVLNQWQFNPNGIHYNGGKVGIGTATPSYQLSIQAKGEGTGAIDDRILTHINNTATNSASSARSLWTAGGSTNITSITHHSPTYSIVNGYANYGQLASDGAGLVLQANSGILRFETGLLNGAPAERMRLTNDGKFGIGTPSPNYLVSIQGRGEGTGAIDDRILLHINNTATNSASSARTIWTAGGSADGTTITHHSPTYSIVNGYANYGQVSSSGAGLILQAHNGIVRFETGLVNGAPAERMRVANDGNVGIGTTAPKAKLEVKDGDVYVNDPTKGIILKSPNGGCWRVTVDNTGNFVRTSITCPN